MQYMFVDRETLYTEVFLVVSLENVFTYLVTFLHFI